MKFTANYIHSVEMALVLVYNIVKESTKILFDRQYQKTYIFNNFPIKLTSTGSLSRNVRALKITMGQSRIIFCLCIKNCNLNLRSE